MLTNSEKAQLDRYIVGIGNYAEKESEDCNCCGRAFEPHPRLMPNGYPHCAACLGVEGVDPDTIEAGAFD